MSMAKRKASASRRNQTNDLEQALETLRLDIWQGRFVPGQRLIEADLMEHFHVTRGRIREVFKRLEAEDLVQIDKHRGASVRKVTREEVREIAEVLRDISILMIKRAAKRIDQNGNRAKLEKSLAVARNFRKSAQSIMQVQALMDENARFWGSLAAASDNSVLSEIRLRLQSRLFRLAMQGLTVHANRDKWITDHEEIISSLLDGQVVRALSYAEESMTDVFDSILNLPDSAFGR